jgi:arylsulfatase A
MALPTRRSFLAAAAGAGVLRAAPARRLPNIVVILADDLGYGDVGCYNPASRIPTPNLDKLAAAGVRFTDAHTPSAVCTPTRYGLLTGRYCWRTSLTKGVLDGIDPPLIERGRTTVASMLKARGYATACVGKWHLGMEWTTKSGTPVGRADKPGFRPGTDIDYTLPVKGGPRAAGFDWYFGISASLDMSPYCFIENERTVGLPDVPTAEDKNLFMNQVPGVRTADFRLQNVLPTLTRKAREYVLGRKGVAAPFFLYMPLSAPHLPAVPNDEYRGRSKAGVYGDYVVEMDATVGVVLEALEQSGHASDTVVLFTSDNGGLWHWWDFREADDVKLGKITPRGAYEKDYGHQSNAGWRGTKADIWEGGHRVPFIVRWPGTGRPGGVCERLVGLNDLLATCGEIVGERLPATAGEDSISFLPALRDPKNGKTRTDMVQHSVQGEFAIREGDWKLMPARGSGGFSVPRQVKPKPGEAAGQLYNLRTDPAETKNVYLEHPETVARLEKLLAKYRSEGRSRP